MPSPPPFPQSVDCSHYWVVSLVVVVVGPKLYKHCRCNLSPRWTLLRFSSPFQASRQCWEPLDILHADQEPFSQMDPVAETPCRVHLLAVPSIQKTMLG